MAQKVAIVLFAQAPLLEQAGINLLPYFSAEKCFSLYEKYIEESAQNWEQESTHFWLTCEEAFQETLLLHAFPTVHGCKVAQGDMSEKMVALTNYFLTYEEYQCVIFLFQPFTFISKTILAKIDQAFRRTSRSVLLLTSNNKQLDALAVSFPFSRLYEDIVWEKEDMIAQFKEHCKDAEIPCRSDVISDMVITNPTIISDEQKLELQKSYPRLAKKFLAR